MRKSLPRFTEKDLRYSIKHDTVQEQIAEQEPQQPVSNEPALHTAYINLMGWNCSFHTLAQQSRSRESQRVRGVDFGAVRERIEPAFAKRLRRGSLRLLRYDRVEAGLPSRSLRSKRRLVGATGIEPVTPTMSR